MDIAHFLISLRKKLIEARKERDYRTLGELATVFTVFQEYAVDEQLSRRLIILLDDLTYSANDQSSKTEWANIIPTEETILEALKIIE